MSAGQFFDIPTLHTCPICYDTPVFFTQEDFLLHNIKYHETYDNMNGWAESLRSCTNITNQDMSTEELGTQSTDMGDVFDGYLGDSITKPVKSTKPKHDNKANIPNVITGERKMSLRKKEKNNPPAMDKMRPCKNNQLSSSDKMKKIDAAENTLAYKAVLEKVCAIKKDTQEKKNKTVEQLNSAYDNSDLHLSRKECMLMKEINELKDKLKRKEEEVKRLENLLFTNNQSLKKETDNAHQNKDYQKEDLDFTIALIEKESADKQEEFLKTTVALLEEDVLSLKDSLKESQSKLLNHNSKERDSKTGDKKVRTEMHSQERIDETGRELLHVKEDDVGEKCQPAKGLGCCKAKQDEIHKLQKMNNSLNDTITTFRRENTELLNALTQQLKEKENISSFAKDAELKLKDRESENVNLSDTIKILQNDLVVKETNFDALQANYEKIISENFNTLPEEKFIKEQLTEVKSNLNEERRVNLDLLERQKVLISDLSLKDDQLSNLKMNIANAEQNVSTLAEKNKDLVIENKKQQTEVKRLSDDITSVVYEKEVFENDIDSLINERDILQEENFKLKDITNENKDKEQKLILKEKELKDLMEEFEKAKAGFKETQGSDDVKIYELEERIQQLKKELREKEVSYLDVAGERDNLSKELTLLLEEKNEQDDELSDKRQMLVHVEHCLNKSELMVKKLTNELSDVISELSLSKDDKVKMVKTIKSLKENENKTVKEKGKSKIIYHECDRNKGPELSQSGYSGLGCNTLINNTMLKSSHPKSEMEYTDKVINAEDQILSTSKNEYKPESFPNIPLLSKTSSYLMCNDPQNEISSEVEFKIEKVNKDVSLVIPGVVDNARESSNDEKSEAVASSLLSGSSTILLGNVMSRSEDHSSWVSLNGEKTASRKKSSDSSLKSYSLVFDMGDMSSDEETSKSADGSDKAYLLL